ncbi:MULTISPECIES: TRM11 family SAM-dependent methyltransferase [Clostridium]|jgi:DNA modification methylase|uniref:Methyltransferase n=1 Tax=Clostridium colicanis DSM 13634 TaxID=1121305 RepID=A0A151AKF6_9CLOT|nr:MULTISPECIES: DNA methyltransferase [Clostridium]KYH28101.1 modification methylase DpnIIB [Clostridium colicanis DSM 13634]MBE6043048.1 methyltransferase domain-containing protein [Clostridium thermopalmarium]
MESIKQELQQTTLWSFKERGNWATHKGDYPGNWSPYIPRNVILRYSKEGDLVLDQFLGGGTTAVEAALLNRKFIGIDVNDNALSLARKRCRNYINKNVNILKGDAKNLVNIKNETINLICTHPPYSNIIRYSNSNKDDISLLQLEEYYKAMDMVAKECFRILKRGSYCAILLGDTRKNGFIEPLGFKVMNSFINAGFKIKEIIIKEQHNCSSAKKWLEISKKRNFLLIAHEYLFVFKKS